MTIEWMPRSTRTQDGAPMPTGNADVATPTLDEVDGRRSVRIPVVRQGARLRGSLGWWIPFVVWQLYNKGESAWGRLTSSVWPILGVLLVAGLFGYRWLRLRPLAHRGDPDLYLATDGIHTAGMVVPWTLVEQVVAFRLSGRAGRGRIGPRRYLAVRVTDFVGVRGLSPARAGLANLTRRHLVVLCESREVRDPAALSAALHELVANPGARELLSGHEGVRLATVGPALAA